MSLCLSLCSSWLVSLKGEWRIVVSHYFLYSSTLYFGWHPGATTCQFNSFILPPFLSVPPPHRPHHLFSTAVDSCWHSTGIKTQPVLVCPMVIGKLPSSVSLPKQSGQYVMNKKMKKVYYCWKYDLDLLHNSHDFPLVVCKWLTPQDTTYSSDQPPKVELKIKYYFLQFKHSFLDEI